MNSELSKLQTPRFENNTTIKGLAGGMIHSEISPHKASADEGGKGKGKRQVRFSTEDQSLRSVHIRLIFM